MKCHSCGSSDLEIVEGAELLHRVTSDCKPFPPGGIMAGCRMCGLAQFVTTPKWQKEADAIYGGYTIYHQSGGVEQSVFSASSEGGSLRSDVIIRSLLKHHSIGEKGRLLDVGCGNGSFLKACHQVLPEWDLFGSEYDDKYKDHVEALPGVKAMHACDLSEIEGTYDVISLIHVLEHIPSPSEFLKQLPRLLAPGGVIFVEVPDCQVNPFALLIADHCSHFAKSSLANVALRAGMDVKVVSDQWVARELSMVCSPADGESHAAPDEGGCEVLAGVDWLKGIHQQVSDLGDEAYGIFGTSIAATALDSQMGDKAQFFVDEDPNRRGKTHLGKPILAPDQLEHGATVYVALPPPICGFVSERLSGLGKDLRLIQPEALP